ncbi:MAG: AI-2E family transporter [Chloroflexota bacterium]
MSWTKAGAKITLGAAAVLLGLFVLYLIRPVLIILVVSIIFAQAISPLVLQLRRFGARRAPAVLAIYMVILAAIAALGWFLWQAISSQVGTLVSGLPEMQQKLQQLAAGIPFDSLRESVQAMLSSSAPTVQPGEAVPGVVNTLRALVEGVFAAFSVFVVTFYWISERLTIRRTMLRLLPARHAERGLNIWDDVEAKLGMWVRGQLLVMLCIGAAFAIGLGLLGVKFWLLLAVFAALAEIIPLAGPYIGTIPAILVALTQGVQLAGIVAGFGVLVQLLENNILVPRIMGHATGVSPLTVILGILIGATLMGIPGALLAVPLAAAIQVLLTDLEVLSDDDEPLADIAEQREAVAAR